MKAIIPLAGKGTRLRPHTHITPKPLIKVGGRPVMSYILDDLVELGVREVVFVVGYLGDVIRAYIEKEYPQIEGRYVVQEVQDGTAGAVKLAEPWADEELLILFVDTIFDADLTLVNRLPADAAGVLWAKEVDDYQRFGVIITGEDGSMERIVEKPEEPVSRLANIGLYYIRDHELLFEGIHHTLDTDPGPGGEYYLTDAFQYMVDNGAKIVTAPVRGWWDAGKPETLLETNGHLISVGRGGVDPAAEVEGAEIVEPVRIEAGVTVRGGRIGPNVTLEQGTKVVDCEIEHTVVGPHSVLERSRIRHSIVGGHARIVAAAGTFLVTDHSVVEGA